MVIFFHIHNFFCILDYFLKIDHYRVGDNLFPPNITCSSQDILYLFFFNCIFFDRVPLSSPLVSGLTTVEKLETGKKKINT